jgi:hypothetical protein
MEMFGKLARGEAVCFPEDFEQDVLSDAHAVAAHRFIGCFSQQLRCSREQGEELVHRHADANRLPASDFGATFASRLAWRG